MVQNPSPSLLQPSFSQPRSCRPIAQITRRPSFLFFLSSSSTSPPFRSEPCILFSSSPPKTNLVARVEDWSLFLDLSLFPSISQSFSLWSLIFLLLWWCGWWCFSGFYVGWWWIFWYKICLEAEKMWKFCRKIAFSECYQTLEIVFRTIFHCILKRLDFNFLTGIHFPLHSFYTKNSIYIKPNAALVQMCIKVNMSSKT